MPLPRQFYQFPSTRPLRYSRYLRQALLRFRNQAYCCRAYRFFQQEIQLAKPYTVHHPIRRRYQYFLRRQCDRLPYKKTLWMRTKPFRFHCRHDEEYPDIPPSSCEYRLHQKRRAAYQKSRQALRSPRHRFPNVLFR